MWKYKGLRIDKTIFKKEEQSWQTHNPYIQNLLQKLH